MTWRGALIKVGKGEFARKTAVATYRTQTSTETYAMRMKKTLAPWLADMVDPLGIEERRRGSWLGLCARWG